MNESWRFLTGVLDDNRDDKLAELLAVSEKLFLNFFNFKHDSVWSPTLGDDNKNITREGTYTVVSIYGGTILIEDLVRHKTLGNVQSLLHAMGHC